MFVKMEGKRFVTHNKKKTLCQTVPSSCDKSIICQMWLFGLCLGRGSGVTGGLFTVSA